MGHSNQTYFFIFLSTNKHPRKKVKRGIVLYKKLSYPRDRYPTNFKRNRTPIKMPLSKNLKMREKQNSNNEREEIEIIKSKSATDQSRSTIASQKNKDYLPYSNMIAYKLLALLALLHGHNLGVKAGAVRGSVVSKEKKAKKIERTDNVSKLL